MFPIKKFEIAKNLLLEEGTLTPQEIVAPELVDRADLLLVHTEDYITRLAEGRLTAKEVRKLGLPWSPALVRRSFTAINGTINAAKRALDNRIASNLAGGTHHAYPDRGEGFCVLNDVAVSIRVLQREKLASKFLIIDLDVHQGNGTAHIFRDSPEVFTFSMHGAKNYPLFKETSRLDIELADGTGDEEYLETLDHILPSLRMHDADVIFYLAGADPYEHDRLGRLKLTKEGLKSRDERVLQFAKGEEIPIVTTLSGGYAQEVHDTVDIHCNTIRAVKSVFFNNK